VDGTTNKVYSAAEKTKLTGIEASADVTDTTNVTAAGALMDSELTSLSGVKSLTVPDSTTIPSVASGNVLYGTGSNILAAAAPGATSGVQAYDADTAKLDADQTWTGSQRATVVTDNDGSFDMNAGNDFSWTPTGNDTLEFTNETSGQRGMIILVNTTPRTISLGSEVKAPTGAAAALSVAGTYLVSYWCYDGTNVAITYSGAIS